MAAAQVSNNVDPQHSASPVERTEMTQMNSSYDMRAFGDFGWAFVNAGEQYRKLKKVSKEDGLMMCGIFKQATMGDCQVEEPKRNEQEIKQRAEWLKYKGTDHIAAMQLYIDKVKELANIYETNEEPSDGQTTGVDAKN